MTKIKHSPGPWETGQAHWNEDGDVMYTLHGIKEAKVADCLLIAAAPDMLDALKDALDLLEREFLRPAPNGQIVKARRAIAKAEGR